jgi:SNF2-related domain/LAGLIDADG-like domain
LSTVFGELDPTGQHILVTCTGDDHDLSTTASVLLGMTPNVVPTQNPAVMAVPLSWASVTQLAFGFPGTPAYDGLPGLTWVPGEQLGKWLMAEIIRRSCEGDWAGEWPKLEPMKHQRAGGIAVGMNGRFLFGDDMGPQPVTTPLLTPRGWTELGKLQPGDKVYAQDGTPSKVLERKDFGTQPVYRVTFSDRTSTLATGRHLWSVQTPNHRFRGQGSYVLSTDQLLEQGLTDSHGNSRFFLPQQPVVDRGPAPYLYEIDPYAYGALLGDGYLDERQITLACPDNDILERVSSTASKLGTEATLVTPENRCKFVRFSLLGRLRTALRIVDAFHLATAKAVHPWYLLGDVDARRETLRGLLDTDGSVDPRNANVEFSSVSSQLAKNVAFLGRSLGAVVTESDPQSAHYVKDGKRIPAQDKYRVLLRFPADGINPFWCDRKASAWALAARHVQRKQPPRAVASITPEGEAEVCCIRIEHDSHVYLTDTALIPTHNTGKTLSYLMGLTSLDARNRDPWPALFVTPASVVDTVLEEIPKFYPSWKAVAYRGSGRQRYLRSDTQILVMSYETMRNDVGKPDKPGPLMKFRAGTVIADECHLLCNFDSWQSRAMRRLSSRVRNFIPGSGTPITSSVVGFWPVLNALAPESYPSRERYKTHFCIGRRAQYGNGDREISGLDPLRAPEFHAAMQGTFRRVALEDVVDMPPKTYQARYVEIPAAWRAAYNQMEEDMLAELPDSMTPLEVQTTLVKMMRLRQLACSACDVEVTREIEQNPRSPKFGQEVQHTKVTPKEPCWKGAALVSLLDEIHQAEGELDDLGRHRGHVVGSRPVIAFAESRQLTRLAGKMAEAKGYAVGFIDGDVSPRDRTPVRLAFQANKLDLLCVTTGAGGVGLNLTASGDVAFLANPWGFVARVQSERRSWRRGQDKPVMIYDFIAKDSIESRVAERLKEKAGNLADLVRDRRIVEGFLGGTRH